MLATTWRGLLCVAILAATSHGQFGAASAQGATAAEVFRQGNQLLADLNALKCLKYARVRFGMYNWNLDAPQFMGRPSFVQMNEALQKAAARVEALPICPPETALTVGASLGPEFTIGAGLAYLGLPKRSFLGFEPMGAPAPTLGLFSPDRNATGSSFSGSIKFNFDAPVGMQLSPARATTIYDLYPLSTTTTYGKVSFYHLSADINQQIGTIDPGTDNRLVIPGPLGGPSGFSLGMYPFNIVRDATYSADFNRTGARIDIGHTTKLPNSFDFDYYGSAGYAHSSFYERFAGSIPLFMRDFAYTSSADVDQLKLRAGFAVGKQFVVSQAFTTHVGVFAEIGPDLSWARGSDSLDFTGFPTSSIALSASKTDIGFTTGVRLGATLSNGFRIAAQISYLRATGLPLFERDGNGPTVLKLEAGDMWTASVRGSVKF